GTGAVAENAAGADTGITLTVADPENDAVTWAVTGTGSDKFEVVAASGGGYKLKLKSGQSLNFEDGASYTLTLTATDDGIPPLSHAVEVTVVVTNVNEAPVITAAGTGTVAENADGADTGITLTVADPDAGDTPTWTIAGTGSDKFEVVAASGGGYKLKLKSGQSLDFEGGTTSYTLTITATDGNNLTDDVQVTVNVTDVNDSAPVVTATGSATVAENAAGADIAGLSLAVADADRTNGATTWTVTDALGNSLNNLFEVVRDGSNWKLKLKTGQSLDFEQNGTRTIKVIANDGVNDSVAVDVTITVTDVNDNAPVFTEASYAVSVAENIAAGIMIATVAATDADTVGTLQYRITAGDDDGLFAIDATTGVITLATGKALDYEKAQAHTLTVEVSDGTNTDTASVVVTVTDIFDVEPVFTLATNSPSGEMLDIATDGSTIAKPLGITFTIDPADARYMSFAVKVNDVVSSDFAVEMIGNVLTLVFKGTAHALSALSSDPLLDLSITVSAGDDAQTAYNVELAQNIVIHLHDNKYVKWNELSDGSYGFNIYNNADDQIILEDSKLNGDDFAYSNIIYLDASWAIDPTNSKSAPPSELTLGAGYDIYVIGNDIAADVHIVDDVTGLDTTALKNLIRFEDGVTVISNVEDSNTLPGFTGASTNILTLDTDGDAQTTEDQVELKIVGEAFEFQIGLGDVMTFDEMIGHFLPEVI
ncbi:cadherin domain-containing protein, partial [Alphaproteobacteria bacterium]|nr:cadherin domain-containing protein [Alphaproteobacteria bacterium]